MFYVNTELCFSCCKYSKPCELVVMGMVPAAPGAREPREMP